MEQDRLEKLEDQIRQNSERIQCPIHQQQISHICTQSELPALVMTLLCGECLIENKHVQEFVYYPKAMVDKIALEIKKNQQNRNADDPNKLKRKMQQLARIQQFVTKELQILDSILRMGRDLQKEYEKVKDQLETLKKEPIPEGVDYIIDVLQRLQRQTQFYEVQQILNQFTQIQKDPLQAFNYVFEMDQIVASQPRQIDFQNFKQLTSTIKYEFDDLDFYLQQFLQENEKLNWKFMPSNYQNNALDVIQRGFHYKGNGNNHFQMLVSDLGFSKGIHGFTLQFDQILNEERLGSFVFSLVDDEKQLAIDNFIDYPFQNFFSAQGKDFVYPKDNNIQEAIQLPNNIFRFVFDCDQGNIFVADDAQKFQIELSSFCNFNIAIFISFIYLCLEKFQRFAFALHFYDSNVGVQLYNCF